jgi:hypothetical protein
MVDPALGGDPPAFANRPVIELRWHVLVPWLSLTAILLFASRADPDLWGHVRFGLDWLAERRLPSIDPYSFTQDRPWINHEWLSEALMSAAFSAAGAAGLVLLKVAVIGAALAVLWRRLRAASPLIAATVVTIAAVGALPVSATIRPQIWSLLGLTLLAPLLVNPVAPSARRIAVAALLFAVWANLHGGWITGGAVLAVYATVRSIRSPAQAPRWIALGAASLLATLVNPYGVGLWRFLGSTVRATRPDITEWRPFSLHEPAIMWVSILAPFLILAALSRRRHSRPAAETIAVVCLLVAAGLRISRVAPLMCPAALAFLAPDISRAWGSRGALRASSRGGALVLLGPLLLTPFAAWTPVRTGLACLPVNDVWAPDRSAAASLAGASGRLWTTFDWGQYALWHFGPALAVSIDGRRETVYSDDVVAWHRGVEEGRADAIDRMVALEPDYVWLPSSKGAARAALIARGYRLDVDSQASFILTREDLPALPAARPALPGCFP